MKRLVFFFLLLALPAFAQGVATNNPYLGIKPNPPPKYGYLTRNPRSAWTHKVPANATYTALSKTAGPTAAGTIIPIASPGVVNWTGHGFQNGAVVWFTTTGALPTGLTASTPYYVVNKATNTFQVSASYGGGAINFTGSESGNVTVTSGTPTLYGGLDSWYGNQLSIPIYDTWNALVPLYYNSLAWYYRAVNGGGSWLSTGNTRTQECAASGNACTSTSVAYWNSGQWPNYNSTGHTGNAFSTITTAGWTLPPFFNYQTIGTALSGRGVWILTSGTPATGTDGHVVYTQPNGKKLEVYSGIIMNAYSGTCSGCAGGANLTYGSPNPAYALAGLAYNITNPAGLSDGFEGGSITASMIPSYAGVIDDREMSEGAITHPLAIDIPGFMLQANAVTYPAIAFDNDAATNTSGGGYCISGCTNIATPMGSLMAIPWSAGDVGPVGNALGLSTTEGKLMAQAAQKYGCIIADRGGPNGITIRVRMNSPVQNTNLHTYGTNIQNDVNAIIRALKVVNK